MREVGRALQVIGLVLPLTGLMLGLSGSGSRAMNLEIALLGGGAAIFTLGWWLQRQREG
ncbi:MAG: hypothetical protein ACYSX0_03965 [Planctomycetota bacterium]